MGAQFVAEKADKLTTCRSRDGTPDKKGSLGRVDGMACGFGVVLMNLADDFLKRAKELGAEEPIRHEAA